MVQETVDKKSFKSILIESLPVTLCTSFFFSGILTVIFGLVLLILSAPEYVSLTEDDGTGLLIPLFYIISLFVVFYFVEEYNAKEKEMLLSSIVAFLIMSVFTVIYAVLFLELTVIDLTIYTISRIAIQLFSIMIFYVTTFIMTFVVTVAIYPKIFQK